MGFAVVSQAIPAAAEGTDVLGTSQAFGGGNIYVDVLDAATETIAWTGSGTVTLYDSADSALGSITSGEQYIPLTAETYRLAVPPQSAGGTWDIAVRVNGTPTTGRVHAPAWNFNAGNYVNGFSASVYITVPGGNGVDTGVVEIAADGFAGYVYALRANQTGITDANGRSQLDGGGVTFDEPLYELYLNPPTISTYTALVPVVWDESFEAGQNGQSCASLDPAVNTGRFEFTSNVEGGYWLTCDLNGDGLFNPVGSEDTSRSGTAAAGLNVVLWDGRANDGSTVTNGTYECELTVTVGDVHFMAQDVETSFLGFRMYEVLPDGLGGYGRTALSMWWNDEFVHDGRAVNLPAPYNTAPGARNSPPTGLDSDLYGSSPVPAQITAYDGGGIPTAWSGNARAWGDFSGSSKGNAAWLDTYTRLYQSNVFGITVTIDDGTTDTDADNLNDVFEECIAGSDPGAADSDGDGIPDDIESTPPDGGPAEYIDSDGDGIPDVLDTDSNGDGIPDADEAPGDDDGDGVENWRDTVVVITTPAVVATGQPTITGKTTASILSTITIDVWVDGTLWCDDAAVDSSGDWSCPWPGPTDLTDDVHTITVEVADPGGTIYGSQDVRVDTTPPTVTFDLGPFIVETTPTVSGTTEPNTALDVFVDGELICVTQADGGGAFSCPWPGSRTALDPGSSHTVSAELTDEAGNTGSGSQAFGVDADECSLGSDNCDELVTCTNTLGSFTCGDCPSGYDDTNGDGTLCSDVDECSLGTHGCDVLVTCTNTLGSFTCGDCPSGYDDTNGDGTLCSDVDECSLGTDNCDPLTACFNTGGAFVCGMCPSGYDDTNGNGTLCSDIDECSLGTDNCDPLTACSNTAGGFSCSACPAGYDDANGDGTLCSDFDECSLGTDNCDPLATCTNTAGGFSCGPCPSGYSDANGNGTACADIDECGTEADQCDENATCANTTGTYSCTCAPGFSGSGIDCYPFQITSPTPGDQIAESALTVDGVGEPGTSVTLSVAEAEGCTATVDAAGDWSCLIDGLPEGPATVTAMSTDTGLEDELTITINTSTWVTIESPVGEVDAETLTESPEHVSGTAEPGAAITLMLNGESVCEITAGDDGDWSCALETANDGRYTAEAIANDGLHEASTSAEWLLDTETFVSLDGMAGTISDSRPTFSGTAEPGGTIWVVLDGTVLGSTDADDEGNWSLEAPGDLDDAEYDVEIRIQDVNGNTATTTSTFTVATESPDTDGDGLTDDQEGVDTGRDTDNDGIPDYLDPDDDGDGIATREELPDANDDGDPTDSLDTDGDGIPNYLDPDDDGDGTPTAEENPDRDGDSIPDDATDANDNGVPDYLEPDVGEPTTLGGGGCACRVATAPRTSSTGWWLALGLGALPLVRRRQRSVQRNDSRSVQH